MKSLNQYIKEKLIINKDYHDNMIVVKSFDELRKIIEDRYDKLGAGTKKNPIDFNDIDVSKIDSFYNEHKGEFGSGLFNRTKFKYIDISDWDVSNVKTMNYMFAYCKELKSVGDISYWDVSNVTDMRFMFCNCENFNQDLSSWDVSKVSDMEYMFCGCASFNKDISSWYVTNVTDMSFMFSGCASFNQDLSSWNVSNVRDMNAMFRGCKSFNKDISKWDVSKVRNNILMFFNCPIKDEYKPKFK